MKNREVPRLSERQEQDIVNSLIEFVNSGEAIMHNGSSRVVFCDVDADTYDLLTDFVPAGKDIVIKVNMGRAGVIQSQQERDVYESADDTQVQYLAPIYCYGNCIQVMEAVFVGGDVGDIRGLADDVYYCIAECESYSPVDFAIQVVRSRFCCRKDKDLTEEQIAFVNDNFDDIDKIHKCIVAISALIGWTGDLTQVGRTQNGDIVLYDYGYFSDSNDDCVNDSDDVWRFTQDMWLSVYLEDLMFNYGALELKDMGEIAATIEDCFKAQ